MMITAVVILVCITVYYTIGKNCQSLILTVLCGYIYWLVAPSSLYLILGTSLVMAGYGQIISRCQRKWILCQPILLLIIGFILFRYLSSSMGSPLGYSVVAFSAISLLVDQYRTGLKYSYIDCLSFLLFAPKIFAGPIVRANDFISSEAKRFDWSLIYKGLKYLIFAAFCKLIAGDILTNIECDQTGFTLFFQILLFGLNFFFDFWAYSMMAIGAGMIMGYELPISFNRPYYSTSFRSFWHRWNITLGTWLRDYIYIPMGGKCNSGLKWCVSILSVFIISGLWHGSTWPFLLWGVIHGLLLIIERFIIRPERLKKFGKVSYGIVVFVLVSFLWQLFIIDDVSVLSNRVGSLFTISEFNWAVSIRVLISFIIMAGLTNPSAMDLIENNSKRHTDIIKEVTMLSLMLLSLVIFNCPLSFNFFYFRF